MLLFKINTQITGPYTYGREAPVAQVV